MADARSSLQWTQKSCYTDSVSRRNITITLPEPVARWVRVAAAERAVSVSRFIATLLERRMQGDRAYERAMRANLARRPVPLKESGGYPTREDVHDRPGLRR